MVSPVHRTRKLSLHVSEWRYWVWFHEPDWEQGVLIRATDAEVEASLNHPRDDPAWDAIEFVDDRQSPDIFAAIRAKGTGTVRVRSTGALVEVDDSGNLINADLSDA